MRSGLLLGWAVASAALVACSSSTAPSGQINFTLAEGILVLEPENPAYGYALLSSGTGNCAAVQAGLLLGQIGNLNAQIFLLYNVNSASQYAPLTAGSYGLYDPSSPPSSIPVLFAESSVTAFDGTCGLTAGDNAQSGTVTLSPFNTADGGQSTLIYEGIYDGTTLMSPAGGYTLTTCLVSASTPQADAGTCIQCVPSGVDGGPCAIQ